MDSGSGAGMLLGITLAATIVRLVTLYLYLQAPKTLLNFLDWGLLGPFLVRGVLHMNWTIPPHEGVIP